jgi:hypothetical protein
VEEIETQIKRRTVAMPSKIKSLSIKLMTLAATLMVFTLVTVEGPDAAASEMDQQQSVVSSELPRRPPKVVKFSQLIANGARLGTVVWYDDPATQRLADYLELYDDNGGLVAVSWFDRYGIERMAMDRAFIEGKGRLEGVYVFTVDGDSM